MKETILTTIYSRFADWSKNGQYCCTPGCATCCTTNVTITALEGQRILHYCQKKELIEWLAAKLSKCSSLNAPEQTTNEFIATVLNGRSSQSPPPHHSEDKCPFLDNEICQIYPIRPFSCRCFVSTVPCSTNDTATVSDAYLYGSTAAMQIIEHLGQFDSWGCMCDILLQQASLSGYREIAEITHQSDLLELAQSRLRLAQPIPGFFIPEDENGSIAFLLHSIFSAKIDSRTVEQILNGKKAS